MGDSKPVGGAARTARAQVGTITKTNDSNVANRPEIKPRGPKWTLSSRLKNFFVDGRKDQKIAKWTAAELQADTALQFFPP